MEVRKTLVLFSFQRVGEALEADSLTPKEEKWIGKNPDLLFWCAEKLNFPFWGGILPVGEGVWGGSEDRVVAFFFSFFFVSPLCRRWRQHAGPGCPDLTAPPWFSAVLPFGPPARIRMPSHPSSVRCSWSPALSQVSNGHFGLQFLFLNRPPISESCFNKHSIKRKKPLGDGRHPITEKQGMFTEESYISLVTSSLAKIYEPVCPTAIKLEMWSLNRCVFLINKTN